MKHVVTGVILFVIGFLLASFWGGGNGDSLDSIVILILYLASVIGGATSVIVEELRNR